MKYPRLLFICLLTIFSLNFTYAQNDGFEDWLKNFQSHQAELPTEKVFLHLDKSEYTLGETIWLKSYLVAGAGHIPSPFSQNVYVELMNEAGQTVKRLKLKSNDGLSKASIEIGKELSPGFYYLRAHTNWMKNQASDFFFNKKIKIHSLKVEDVLTETPLDEKLAVGFFPEGGDMIRGVAGKVAFEVSGVSEKKLPLKGKVFNSKDEEVASFETTHEGLGLFALLPMDNQYFAKIEGFEQSFELPIVKQSGVALAVNNKADDFINVVIKSGAACSESFYLVAHTRGYITYASEIRLKSNRGLARIDKSTLPNGISHITLFDNTMKPLAERLAFVNNGQQNLNIDISTSDPQYSARDLATINLKVTDNQGNPVQGSFSMSVFDSKLAQNDQIDYNITANLLLSSDLKGYIKNPSQYLKQDSQSKANTDLLMMVNGWRRFKWSDFNSADREPIYAFEQALELKGQMTKSNGKPVKDGKIFLLNAGTLDNNASKFVLADEVGNFTFENLTFYDTSQMAIQGFQNGKVKNFKYNIDNSYEKVALQKYVTNPVADNPARLRALKEYAITSIRIDSTYRKENGVIYLDDVYVTASKREEQYRTLNSQYGKGESYINFDKMTYEEKNGRDPFTLMLGKLSGFSLANASGGNGGGISMGGNIGGPGDSGAALFSSPPEDFTTANDPIFRKPTLRQGPYQGTPLILIDNIQVPYAAVYDLRATEIDYVEVYKSGSAAMFGSNGFNGAIAFYTLKGDRMFKSLAQKPGVEVISANGYHAAREFYAPKYDETNKLQFIPDERSTLFWAPMITTDSEGKAQVEFYTHDKNSNVFIDVQGISKTGKTGTAVSQFNIRKNW